MARIPTKYFASIPLQKYKLYAKNEQHHLISSETTTIKPEL